MKNTWAPLKFNSRLRFLLVLFFLPPFLGPLSLAAGEGNQLETLSFTWQGLNREAVIRYPLGHRDPQKLLLVLHGGGGTARGMLELVDPRFLERADQMGLVTLWPQAHDKNWNDGRLDWPGAEEKAKIDDVGFLKLLVQTVTEKLNMDKPSVYSTGISNGGMMSFRLAADAPGFLKAIAVVSSTLPSEITKKTPSSLPLLILHGTKDPIIPIQGGPVRPFGLNRGIALPLKDIITYWARVNGGDNVPLVTEGPGYRISEYPTKTPLKTVIFLEGGHTWPGGKQYLGKFLIGETPRTLNAGDLIFDFFFPDNPKS